MHQGHSILVTVIIVTICMSLVLTEDNQTVFKNEEVEKESSYSKTDFNNSCRQSSSLHIHLSTSSGQINVRNVTDITTAVDTHSYYTTDNNLLVAILMTNALAVILSKF